MIRNSPYGTDFEVYFKFIHFKHIAVSTIETPIHVINQLQMSRSFILCLNILFFCNLLLFVFNSQLFVSKCLFCLLISFVTGYGRITAKTLYSHSPNSTLGCHVDLVCFTLLQCLLLLCLFFSIIVCVLCLVYFLLPC